MTTIRSLSRRSRRTVLRSREALLLDHAQGTVIRVERGCLWVTLESDPRDIILAKGMRFEIDRPGRTIVAAETDSTLRLQAPLTRRERLATALLRTVVPLLNAWSGRGARRTLTQA